MITRDVQIGEKRFSVTSDDKYLETIGAAFEPEMVRLFQLLIKPGMVVADIGANIGMTSLLFSQLAAKVYAFEAAPSTFALLKANIDTAGCTNVTPLNVGIGDAAGEMSLTFAANNRSGGFVNEAGRPMTGHVTETIHIETLDACFEKEEALPDFIKIDVEGFEPHVIRGASKTIATARPTVVLELNHFCLNVLQRVALPDFFDQLRSTFPVLIAVDSDNKHRANLHDLDTAYSVMHAHVTRFRFPNIVCGFDMDIHRQIATLR